MVRPVQDALALLGIPGAEARLIRYFLVRPDATPHLREIQRALKLGGASVERALNRLVALGALIPSREEGRTRYSIAPEAPVWRALRILASQTDDPAQLVRDALVDVPGIIAAFVFGSTATGRTHNESDIDLLVVEDPSLDRKALNRRTAEASLLLSRSVNTVRYTPEALAERLGDTSNPAWGFVHEVLRSPKSWVAGDPHQLLPLALAAGIPRDTLLAERA
jgi:predicted nucleotidyltransferase